MLILAPLIYMPPRLTGFKRGAFAISNPWDSSDIMVVGAAEADIALAVNRLRELEGGIVVASDGSVLAELPLPCGGIFSLEPMEAIAGKMDAIQKAAGELGSSRADVRLTVAVLSTAAIPYLRVCEHGLFNIRENRFVDLIVE